MNIATIADRDYGEEYYATHCGNVPYERNDHWLAFFGGIADQIVRSFGPRRVYDAGCAFGFLAEALWDRGVESWGRDISAYAISNVRPDMRRFCDVGSIADQPPGPGVFDLVTCIEVVEHMSEAEALAALDVLTAAAPRILFSSSPSDFAEPTHINVRPVIYWLREFARRGFSPEWTHNALYLAPHAFVAVRREQPPGDGELQLFAEWIRIRSALVEREARIGRLTEVSIVAEAGAQAAEVRAQAAEERAQAAEAKAQAVEDEERRVQVQLIAAQAELAVAVDRASSAQHHVDVIESSTTWRVATLLRRAVMSVSLLRVLARRALRGRQPRRPAMAPNKSVGATVDFSTWIESRPLERAELDLQRRLIQEFSERPLVSIITPVYRVEAAVLDDTIRSVVHQTYENWELCLAVGDDSDAERSRVLRRWEATDPRIKIKFIENSGIARNSNEALTLAGGEWAMLLDHDDLLTPDAIFQLVRAALANPDAALIYSDKDQVGADGTTRQHPLLKCAWAPDIMLNSNYLTHLNMMRVDRLREIGGWDPDTDGAQDWDLFLRVIGTAGLVVHVPRILYHWRQVQTSVASGGLSAKPYAAAAQLRAVTKHLQTAGWAGASTRFEGPMVHVNWPPDWRPFVSLLVCENGAAAAMPAYAWPGKIEVLAAPGAITRVKGVSGAKGDAASVLDALVAAARGDVLVIWDAGLAVRSPDWLAELVGPLANPAIAAVAGAVYRPDDTIDAMGAFSIDGEIRPGFHGLRYLEGGPFGNSAWYGNASATPLRFCALRRSDWRSLQDHRVSGRADLSFTLDLARERGRILLNPFATATAHRQDPFVVTDPGALRSRITATLPNADPFVSPHLTFAEKGWLTFRQPPRTNAADHNFAAEARHSAKAYDATAEHVQQSVLACATASTGPLTSVCWVVPPFEVPFYGGIYTILRSAEFMRVQHGVRPLFAVFGATPGKGTSEAVRATIARAFPALAEAAQIEVLANGDQMPSLGPVDAMICTLWITAFPMLKVRDVRRKFYFLQDWEPLFYPAGTISFLVEATYRFGFHAICNTPSLAESYRALGGTAEHFLPAVDAAVFHPRVGDRPQGSPFRLFCYGRPGTPRNGFETLAVALQQLKRRWGESIDIITAGAEWQPEAHGLGGVVRHLGLLPYADTGALYRACDAGLVAMATRHPSYLPFEFMASGAAVVTNRNPYTAWLLQDGKNAALSEMTHGDIVRSVEAVMTDDRLRSRIVEGGYETIRADHSDWSATCETIYGILDRVCRAKLG